jgi:hypothetical protein
VTPETAFLLLLITYGIEALAWLCRRFGWDRLAWAVAL